jgi:DeoR family transcriptional regulator, suf operon transcriptional repressor
LEGVKESFPSDVVRKLFSQMGADMADEIVSSEDLARLSVEDRLDLLQDILEEEGFNVEWEKLEDAYHIRELNCPYYHIGQKHPEVCTVDQTLISKMLSVSAQKIQCLLDGDNFCTYVVPLVALKEVQVNSA